MAPEAQVSVFTFTSFDLLSNRAGSCLLIGRFWSCCSAVTETNPDEMSLVFLSVTVTLTLWFSLTGFCERL